MPTSIGWQSLEFSDSVRTLALSLHIMIRVNPTSLWFFPGSVSTRHDEAFVHPHANYRAQLSTAFSSHRTLLHSPSATQSRISSHDHAKIREGLAPLEHLHSSNCVNIPSFGASGQVDLDMDPWGPLLAFLASSLPEDHPELSFVLDNVDEHARKMVMTPETHLLVPSENGVHLELVHRFEVEMEHNWYETTVTASLPHRIVSVVDWTSDSPIPLPVASEEGERLPNLGAFVPPGSNFDTVSSVPGLGTGPRFGKALAGKKPKKGCHAKEEGSFAATPTLTQYPVLLSCRSSSPLSPPKLMLQPQRALDHQSSDFFPWGVNDSVEAAQRESERHGQTEAEHPLPYGCETVKELGDNLASPAGWHTLPVSSDPSVEESNRAAMGNSFWRTTNTAWGNNVFAHENWDGRNAWMYKRRPDGSVEAPMDTLTPSVTFSYPCAPNPADTEEDSMAEAQSHIDATVTQLFCTSNMAHDLFYRYGFTEAAGNFQQYNFRRGGAEGDAVIANAQDRSGFDNANLPDGQHGRCRMYLWNTASPYPDRNMEVGIVIHELAHGLSTRLTGGPKNSECLGWDESGGMGEGWGDFVAFHSTSTSTDAMGAWASNRAGGIRNYIYSLDTTVNLTYKTLDMPGYWGVHAIGEIWAEMLWVVQQRLIATYSFSDTLLPLTPNADGSLPPNDFYRPQTFNPLTGQANPLVPEYGNTSSMQLVLDGMKLQPCSPGFFDARDAIIQADEILTG
ncbi:hypothetical protein PAXINDRAFT_20833, partial [Paxillus involutus ATCC 200175]